MSYDPLIYYRINKAHESISSVNYKILSLDALKMPENREF